MATSVFASVEEYFAPEEISVENEMSVSAMTWLEEIHTDDMDPLSPYFTAPTAFCDISSYIAEVLAPRGGGVAELPGAVMRGLFDKAAKVSAMNAKIVAFPVLRATHWVLFVAERLTFSERWTIHWYNPIATPFGDLDSAIADAFYNALSFGVFLGIGCASEIVKHEGGHQSRWAPEGSVVCGYTILWAIAHLVKYHELPGRDKVFPGAVFVEALKHAVYMRKRVFASPFGVVDVEPLAGQTVEVAGVDSYAVVSVELTVRRPLWWVEVLRVV
jgi:hypothetical protein